MQFIKKLMQYVCKRRGIDYNLAQTATRVLAADTKQFFKTIDEFLYTKVYKPHTMKTVFEGAYSYITCDRQEIHNQWTRVKEDWGLLKNILGNNYAKEEQHTKEQTKKQYTRKPEYSTIDDYVNTINTRNKSEVSQASAYETSAFEFSSTYASQVITAVQQYRGKSLEKIQSYLGSRMQLHESLESTLTKAMQCRAQEIKMQDTFPTIRFAKELLSTDMQEYITKNYISSPSSIHQLSESFEKTYGMHISTATFSKYARALIAPALHYATPLRSRREARACAAQCAFQPYYFRQEQISPTIATA